MKLRSKLFIVTVALLATFTLLSLSLNCRYSYAKCGCASAQVASAKTTDKAQPKSDTILVTFVEIGAAKCIPCKAMQPIMKEVAQEYKGQVKVVFHDVWTPQGKADGMKYNIRLIPTQVFLDKEGKEYYRHEGYLPKEEVVRVIKMQGVQ